MYFDHVEFGKMEPQLILTKQVCLFESMRKPPLAWKRFGFHPQSCAEIWTKAKSILTVHRKWSCVLPPFKFTSKTHSQNGNPSPKMQNSSVKAVWHCQQCTLWAAVITLSYIQHPIGKVIPSVPLGYLGHCCSLQGTRTPESNVTADSRTRGCRESLGFGRKNRDLGFLAKMGLTFLCLILCCFLGRVLALYVQIYIT